MNDVMRGLPVWWPSDQADTKIRQLETENRRLRERVAELEAALDEVHDGVEEVAR